MHNPVLRYRVIFEEKFREQNVSYEVVNTVYAYVSDKYAASYFRE